MSLSITNPANGNLITEVSMDTQESLNLKFEKLSTAQKSWKMVSLPNRMAIIQKFSDLLASNIDELAVILSSEVGKPLNQAKNEINGAITRITWILGNVEKYLSDEIMSETPGMTEKIVYEPLGIVCNISAWNYPYLIGINVIVPALLAGNGVFYKPSEFATLTGLKIEEMLLKADLPANTFKIAIGKGEVGNMLLEMPLDGYYFTGSYTTGNYIYQKVAAKMVPCQLELGGKDPLYLTDDIADIKNVAIGTADGAFYNNGQSCCAVERIYVHEKVYEAYIESFINEVKSWKVGDPSQEGVYIAAITREDQIKVLENQVKDALEKGAKLLTGGRRIDKKGNYFEPTVLKDVNNQMLVMQEESFGPIIGIMKVSTDEEAIELMNDTKYGLTAAVYADSQERANQILPKLNAGTAYWNCCDRVSAALPWSGRKHSGFGATLSHLGIRAFTQPKAYHLRG